MDLAISEVRKRLPVLKIEFNDLVYYVDQPALDARRLVEIAEYSESSDFIDFNTYITFDNREISVQGALYSIYTTSFIIVLLLVSIFRKAIRYLTLSLLCCTLFRHLAGNLLLLCGCESPGDQPHRAAGGARAQDLG